MMALSAIAVTALTVMLVAAGTADARPACFGAASRDPDHPCANPKLRTMVVPTPAAALFIPSAPCSPFDAPISACTFGVDADRAGATVALVGDSHAGHWRAALWRVTKALNWSGVSLTRSSCQLSRAVPVAPERKQAECAEWNRGVTQWLADHPSINTIFMSSHSGRVETAPGQSQRAARVDGIISAWNALPETVQRIIVIRDDPFIKLSTLPCVQRAVHKGVDAGRACAFPRRTGLHPDYDVVAARKVNSPRIQVVDLTRFFCGRRLCYPVVGGALVYKDYFDHLTRVFSTSLGPYLLAEVERLMRSPQ